MMAEDKGQGSWDSKDMAASLADRVKSARHEKGLSLQALANLSNVSRSMLSQIERAESSASVSSLYKIAVALGVKLTVLFGDF